MTLSIFLIWGAHAPRVLAIAPSRSHAFRMNLCCREVTEAFRRGAEKNTRGRVCSPNQIAL